MTFKGKLNPGDKLVSPQGKVIEVVKKEGAMYVVKILCIGDDINYKLPEEYVINKCTLTNDTLDLNDCLNKCDNDHVCECKEGCNSNCENEECEGECEEQEEDEMEQDVEDEVVEEDTEDEVVEETVKKSKKEVLAVEQKEKKTIRSVILNQLANGPKTNEELAKAIVDAGISGQTDLKKIKTYVSINLSNLKKAGMQIEKVGRGKHQLVKGE